VSQGVSLDISYEGPLHARLLDAVRRRWRLSRDKMSGRHKAWENSEDQAQAYLKLDNKDTMRQQLKDQGSPQYITIEIPYSYAQMLAMHTYWSSVFLGRTPIFQYAGRHGEPEDAVQAIEALIDYQMTVGHNLVPLYLWLMDVAKYGMGVVGTYWDREEVTVSAIVEEPRSFMGMPIPGTSQKVRKSIQTLGYLGNRIYNVRPFDWFPDPRVPITRFQEGEFCGRFVEIGWNVVRTREAAGIYRNINYLKQTRGHGLDSDRDTGSPRIVLPNVNDSGSTSYSSGGSGSDMLARGKEDRLDFVELMEMHIDLIPSDWGLGSGKKPEKWVVVVGNSTVVVHAGPLGCGHNKFPFDMLEYEMEPYGLFKRSSLEIQKPLNDTLTWLFNSHFHNVRKVLNDQLIVDPSRIEMKDLLDPKPGRLIRLKPDAYGTDVREAVHQLQVTDITRAHLTDAQVVIRLLNFLTGVSENMLGGTGVGGRRSATESRISAAAGGNRLKVHTEFFSAQGFSFLGQKLVQNTQQYYDIEKMFRIAGPLIQRAQNFINVTPDGLAGFYDYVPIDGTMPIDRYAMAALWKDIMTQMAGIPSLMMQYDLGAIFAHVAQLTGIRNLQQFKLAIQPDEATLQQAQMGNVIPLGGKRGGSTPASISDSGTTQRPAGPAPTSGVGAPA